MNIIYLVSSNKVARSVGTILLIILFCCFFQSLGPQINMMVEALPKNISDIYFFVFNNIIVLLSLAAIGISVLLTIIAIVLQPLIYKKYRCQKRPVVRAYIYDMFKRLIYIVPAFILLFSLGTGNNIELSLIVPMVMPIFLINTFVVPLVFEHEDFYKYYKYVKWLQYANCLLLVVPILIIFILYLVLWKFTGFWDIVMYLLMLIYFLALVYINMQPLKDND